VRHLAGKCTVTAASTVEQAQAVAAVIGKLVIDLFVQVEGWGGVGGGGSHPLVEGRRRSRLPYGSYHGVG
jgi:hypothetical protein